MDRKSSKHPEIHRIALTALCMLALGLLLVAGVACMQTMQQAQSNATPIQMDQTLQLEEISVITDKPDVPQPDFAASELDAAEIDADLSQLHTGSEEIVNILLVGQDAVNKAGARSDTIILCTFNKKQNTITLTSFLRDMYVKIPGHKSNRINAAYSFGGIELLNETLRENFNVKIDGNVQVDFSRFEEIIDKLGGVTLELTAAEAAFINKHIAEPVLTEGTQLLNGEQALMYARDRYDVDGDFSRTNRQRKLLNVLIETYKSKKLTVMLSLMHEMLPMITTDISKADLTAYALTLFPMLSSAEIQTQAIPVKDGYYAAKIGGKAVLVPDLEKNIQALEDALA